MNRFLLTFLATLLMSGNSFAHVRYVLPKDGTDYKGKDINIYYVGDIESKKIVDLMTVIDKFNINAPEARSINLYIDSSGGSIDAGLIGSAAIKSSKIPIKAINISKTSSAATMLYCAAPQRYVMNGARFLLHAPSAHRSSKEILKPDVVDRTAESLKRHRSYLSNLYSECTSLDKKDIKKMLSAEFFSKTVKASESVEIGLSSQILSVYFPAVASAYISDAPVKE